MSNHTVHTYDLCICGDISVNIISLKLKYTYPFTKIGTPLLWFLVSMCMAKVPYTHHYSIFSMNSLNMSGFLFPIVCTSTTRITFSSIPSLVLLPFLLGIILKFVCIPITAYWKTGALIHSYGNIWISTHQVFGVVNYEEKMITEDAEDSN